MNDFWQVELKIGPKILNEGIDCVEAIRRESKINALL